MITTEEKRNFVSALISIPLETMDQIAAQNNYTNCYFVIPLAANSTSIEDLMKKDIR